VSGPATLGSIVIRYLRTLTLPRIILWGYLIWYLVVFARYFEASAALWLNSLGISVIIGSGLYLSTAYAGKVRTALEPWQIFRLYLMPFCVSSFAALIKGRDFVLVFHPSLRDNALAFGCIGVFLSCVALARSARGTNPRPSPSSAGGSAATSSEAVSGRTAPDAEQRVKPGSRAVELFGTDTK
jgi:hypothetical protein